MGLTVIGAGFGRTGTLSIRAALEQLGFGPCYHMDNVFASAEHLERWQALADGGPADWEGLFAGHVSTVDWPGMLYYRELADAYPNAKVILSVRPADGWWKSFSTTIRKLIESRDSASNDHTRAVLSYANQIIAGQSFGGKINDKDAVLAAYQRHNDEVMNSIAPERLLVYDVTEGWGPLCQYLEVPAPGGEFPHVNDADQFWQHFGAGVT
jgi:hypothetical protein